MFFSKTSFCRFKNALQFATKIQQRLEFTINRHSLVYFCHSATTHVTMQPVVSLCLLGSQQRLHLHNSHGNNTKNSNVNQVVPMNFYEKVSENTLENLSEVLDHLLEEMYPNEFDVSLSNGVLTIQTEKHGTYVINKQTPNRQIWLSSPTSGPKRYNYLDGQWIYSHDSTSLDELLTKEFSTILKLPVTIISLPTSIS